MNVPADAAGLTTIRITRERAREVESLARGAFAPLGGFLGRADYESVLATGRLASGEPWTIPVVLDLPLQHEDFSIGDDVVLADDAGPLAVMCVEDRYRWDRAEHARRVLGTESADHPGVRTLARRGDVLAAGPVRLLADRPRGPLVATPAETRAMIRARGWRTVAGYQTRNPPHRAHEFLHKLVLGLVDGLLLHPVVGAKKRGDFTDEVVLDAYAAALGAYYPRDRVALAALPYDMHYAGPREAVHHAIVRRNHGCTHFIVGRDHAGVGGFYRPEAAIELFEEYPDLGITPIAVRGDHFWCRACGQLESERTCPHPREARVEFSGTLIRKLLADGGDAPPELMRPEVLAAIAKHARPFVEDGA